MIVSTILQIASEIIGHKGTMELINDTKIVGNGSHYVGDYLGWGIWVFVEGYHLRSPKKKAKYVFLQKDEEEFPISWKLKLEERFIEKDTATFCVLYYREAR